MTRRVRGFAPWTPQAETRLLMERVAEIIEEYREHLPLTARQIFYRLVGRHGYEKTEKAYNRLQEHLNRARRGGLIEFGAMRDDGFYMHGRQGWEGAEEFTAAIRERVDGFRIDRQRGQERRVLVWCEAGGMVPQLERVARPYGVPVASSGGFDSTTSKHDTGRWLAGFGRALVLHIGDHDPSGEHIYSSLDEDVRAFAEGYGGDVEFHRLAVTSEQVDRYELPTSPPKPTDHRSFADTRTTQAEALDPETLAELVESAIVESIDVEAYEQALDDERRITAELSERFKHAFGGIE